MGVMFQAFYWDCPQAEDKVFHWWEEVHTKIPELAKAGFTALWLPPASKAANIFGLSMGYDPYDYYDLGEFDQKGGIPTLFGTKEALQGLIRSAHENGLQVYADMVLNHNSGADAQELNLISNQQKWTKFEPASGKFPRDWHSFHPSPYESFDDGTFGEMPDLSHRNPYVYKELIEYACWLLEEVGFDGFRYDMVKGFGAWVVRSIQELRALRDGKSFKPFGVGEFWDADFNINEWLTSTNIRNENPASAFDFPLRAKLKALCDEFGFPLTRLLESGTVLANSPDQAVTFVDNHDTHPPHEHANPIVNDKLLAYSFILTHEGYPCVFWMDYFNLGLAKVGSNEGIAKLVDVHEKYAAGKTDVLYVDQDIYIMQRAGAEEKTGLIYVLNNRGDAWQGRWVGTKWSQQKLRPVAWNSNYDNGIPDEEHSNGEGWVELWAPPRGYAVFVPS